MTVNNIPENVLFDIIRHYHEGRCYACGWTLAPEHDAGCVPGDCSYRPGERDSTYRRWRDRMTILDDVQNAITTKRAAFQSTGANDAPR